MATPLSAAVVVSKEGDGGAAVVGGDGAGGVALDSGVCVGEVGGELGAVWATVDADDGGTGDVAAAESSSRAVDEGAGPLPSTLFGHR